MKDEKSKGVISPQEEKGLKVIKIKEIKNRLNALKQHLGELNNYRDRWADFDVAVLCYLLAHDPDELEFWKKIEF